MYVQHTYYILHYIYFWATQSYLLLNTLMKLKKNLRVHEKGVWEVKTMYAYLSIYIFSSINTVSISIYTFTYL